MKDIKWENGALISAQIESLLGDKGLVRYNGEDVLLNLKKGETKTIN